MRSFTLTDIKARFPDAIERTYEAGQVIIYDGDAPGFVRFIKSGAVKFYDTNADGNENIMQICGAGGIFPLFYSFEDKKQVDGFYATLTKTEVIMVPLGEFRKALQTSVEYTFQTLQWYATEMDHMVLRLKSMEKSTAKQKVLQALLYLADKHAAQVKTSKWFRTNFPVTQQTIADLSGLTRETVNVTLNDNDCARLVRNHRYSYDIDKDGVADALVA